jgi:hypothetical protein
VRDTADLQAQIAAAMLTDATPHCAPQLVGGGEPMRRFAIHTRHYAASVARAIVDRFVATVWLVGSEPIVREAAAFVRHYPPTTPCMAEYGDGFPAFLESRHDHRLPPYVGQFATLDWHLGHLAIAADAPAMTSLSGRDPAQVAESRIVLQGGLAHVSVDWSLDELASFFLSGEAPDSYALRQESVWLELRGSRGELSMRRLAHGEFVFRRTLRHGVTLADAAAAALDVDAAFSPGDAVTRLFAEGLVTGIRHSEHGVHDARRL